YIMNEKVPPTASNRRKRELAREGDLVTYKRKRKTIDPSTIVPPNTVDNANKGVCEGVNIPIESAEGVNISQSLKFETESAQAGLGAQPPLPNVCPDFDENIPIFGGYSEGEGATSNDDVGPSDKSLLRSFRFHRARSIALGQMKLPIRVHHHQSTWDLRKKPQVVQDFVKLKGLDRIGDISYNYYNSALIYAFVERWQPETNTFHFKWGEMTPTLDDVEKLVGLPADGDATVIGGTWGFSAILEVFENNLLQDLNAFKSLKAGGARNLLSLKKLKSHYAYKLEKVLSDDVSARYLVLFAKEKVAKKWSWGLVVLAHMYYNLGAASRDDARQFACCTTLLESWIFAYFPKLGGIPKEMDSDAYEHSTCWKWDVSITDRYGGTTLLNFREALDNYKLDDVSSLPFYTASKLSNSNKLIKIHQRKPASVNKHGDTPVHQSEDIAEQYDASHHEHFSRSPNINLNDQQITVLNYQLQKLKEDKEKESKANINLREALKEKTSECGMLKETIEQIKAEIELKRVVDKQCALEFVDLPRQLDAKCKEIESLKAVNALLVKQIDLQLPPAIPPVPDTTLAKKYEDLLAAHEDIKKKLIAKEDFALASEGMRDMGDPTFKEIFEQNERFFTIAQQGPKGDYQEGLVSTAVTLENVVIARREKMAKKKKMQELLFQPWMKYLVDVRGVEISDNNSSFRVTTAVQYQIQHKFPDIMKSFRTFLCKYPTFWRSIFSQVLGIQFTADGENACQILLQACSYGHQHVEYRHMAHLLATYYEKVVVFINHTEAYTFLPLFWARKRNATSNEERFQNLVMDTSKYWWLGLGADNHFVCLFPRFDAPIPLLYTILYSHVNLEIPPGFQKKQLTRYFDVRVKNFKALLREHKCQGYKVNDMVAVGLSTIK
ncbi:hypothetical protein GIB67_020095, partial [Kingdonia uniflora]